MGVADPNTFDVRIGSRDTERLRVLASVDALCRNFTTLVLVLDLSVTGARIEAQLTSRGAATAIVEAQKDVRGPPEPPQTSRFATLTNGESLGDEEGEVSDRDEDDPDAYAT